MSRPDEEAELIDLFLRSMQRKGLSLAAEIWLDDTLYYLPISEQELLTHITEFLVARHKLTGAQ